MSEVSEEKENEIIMDNLMNEPPLNLKYIFFLPNNLYDIY